MSTKKRRRAETGQTPYPDYDPRPVTEPRPESILLRPGTRKSANAAVRNPSVSLSDLDNLLELWEMARQDRHRKKGRRQRLTGLFGSGRD